LPLHLIGVLQPLFKLGKFLLDAGLVGSQGVKALLRGRGRRQRGRDGMRDGEWLATEKMHALVNTCLTVAIKEVLNCRGRGG